MKQLETPFLRRYSFLNALVLGIFVLLIGCKNEAYVYEQNQVKGEPYNPDLPVEITGFTPVEGKIREKVVISGSNFGNDPSKIKVFFDDGRLAREANVVSTNGTSVYCLVPRLSDGRNQIKVSVSENPAVTAPQYFQYRAAAAVSWVAGVGLRDGIGARYVDGALSEAHFWQVQGIVSLPDEQLMTFGYWESNSNKVRLISVKDDKVITLQNGVYLGKGANNASKTRVYATTLNPPHTVYEYKKEAGWAPYVVGVINIPKYTSCCDRIRSLVMMDEAHDPEQEWLYFCHKDKTFGRFNINTEQTEILSDETLDVPVKSWGGYLVYDSFQDCFYVSLYESYSIYKITKTGSDWSNGVEAELFAGSPSESKVLDGDLKDARFKQPMGMCMDDEGNLYICDSDGADVIRKISGIDGYVSTIAGTLNKESPQVNGDPAEAVFLDPYDISYDGNGNFYIAEWWEATIRKYAVE
jgi:hypothetical protein